MSEERKPILESISTLKEAGKEAPKLEGVPTGIEGLDDMFFITKIIDGKPKKTPLGGIPKYAVINITGVSDTGKSLFVEQFAVKRASENDVLIFVTVETPAPFLAMSLKERAKALNVPENKVDQNIIIIDAASYQTLRENIQSLLDTLAYAIRKYKASFLIIDSITGLYEAREMMARIIVRQIFNFAKKWYQTTLLVSQKRSGHEELSAEAAGGFAVSHIVDCTMVMSKQTILTRYDERMYGMPIGELVRFFRIDGCRMCGHDTSTHIMEITETGLIKIGPSLKEILKKGVKYGNIDT